MRTETIVATIYTTSTRVYFQTKFFTLKLSNTHVYDPDELLQTEDGFVYPNANESTIQTDSLLTEDIVELSEFGQYKIKLLVSEKTNSAFIESRTTNLPYEPYYVTANDEVYLIERIRGNSNADKFLDNMPTDSTKTLATNIETGLSAIKPTDEIKSKTNMVLEFNL